MKRILAVCLAIVLLAGLFAGCTKASPSPSATAKPLTLVGMATDSGTIDDKSFNQGTWEGILRYAKDKGTIQTKYLQPAGEQMNDYVTAITDLYDAGYKIIVTPGFKFETAVNQAATTFTDATFILIDGMTHNGDFNFIKHDNTVCVYFNEHEAGFLAGIAAALSTKTKKVGFIGGMEIPAVQRFGWGYKAGIAYANKTYNLTVSISTDDYVYQGTFNDVAGGKTLASGMYTRGVDIIFSAAGGVGIGAINEAKERAAKGEAVWAIGVDSDQYSVGLMDNGKSVILTSAMKRVDEAAYKYIDAKMNGTFPGGQIITLTLKDKAVGLPATNPNLSADVVSKCAAAEALIVAGTVKVPATQADLDAFLK
jgi:basic membrane protein A